MTTKRRTAAAPPSPQGRVEQNSAGVTDHPSLLPARGWIVWSFLQRVRRSFVGKESTRNCLPLPAKTIIRVLTSLIAVLPLLGGVSYAAPCVRLEGAVYNDLNRNGVLDANEPGISGARVHAGMGLDVTTNENGRYTVECAAKPDTRIVVRLDLPAPYKSTTPNPVVVRVSDEMSVLLFGAALDPMQLRLWDETFRPGSIKLTDSALADLEKVVSMLRDGRSEVEIIYAGAERNPTLVLGRIRFVEEIVSALWRAQGEHWSLRITRQWRVEEHPPSMLLREPRP